MPPPYYNIKFKSAKKVNDPDTGKLIKYKVEMEYTGIICNIPINDTNIEYLALKQQVDAGELTIEDAD